MNEKISIAWIDLNLTVKNVLFRNEKIILNKVNGAVNFGSLTALMGPSGAGKTSLLKCINGKIKSGLGKDSKIFLSSEEKISSCFISQQNKEHLFMGLTAQQNMIYASKLKNSENNIKVDHKKNVMNILSELMISDIANTLVMDCSGGEQKRLSIALELTSVIKPNLICIDEPTTGLDSNAAEVVMKSLEILSEKHNISIITSIHQPNSDLLIMFNKLYVLAKGGICVYSGPPQELSSHLTKCEINCNKYEVPIEKLLKISSNDEKNEIVLKLAEKTSIERQTILEKCVKETKLYPNGIVFKSKTFKLIDFWYLLMREISYIYISQWKTLLTQFIFYILYSFILTKMFNPDIGKPDGCFSFQLYSNISCVKQLEDDRLINQNINFLYFMIIVVMFIQLSISTISFVKVIKIFTNEHQNRWYSTGSYYLAKNIVELIPIILYSICLAFLTYYLSGQLLEKQRLLYYIFVITIAMICVQGFAYLCGIIFIENILLAILSSAIGYQSLVMFANYLIIIKDMAPHFQLISVLSFPKYTFNSGLILFYGLNRCQSELRSIVLYNYDVNDEQLWTNIYALIVYAFSLRIIGFILLYFKINTFFKSNKSKVIENSEIEKLNQFKVKEIKLSIDYPTNLNKCIISEKEVNIQKKLSIAWIDLTLISPKQLFKEEKIIISNISGCVEFGSMNALMGPSGAGKTSLLKCINGTNRAQLSDQTMIYLSNSKKIHTCFITQNTSEHLINGLTAKQTLIYASKLKNSDKDVNHENIVIKLMNELLISDISKTNVENCSGGEQKRIVLAMELTSHIMPNLICIDEPTSGLDSNSAEVVIQCLKDLSKKHNISIITSIHQPNSDLLMMFDKLYVLAKGGICVYSGPPQELSSHLTECGINCNDFQIPIELLLKISCFGREDKNVLKLLKKTSEEKDVILKRCKDESILFPNGIQNKSKRFKLIDLWILLSRTMTYTYRYYWKFLLIQYIINVGVAYNMKIFFTPNIGKPKGCVSLEDDFDNCNKSVEKLEEDWLLKQNIKYNLLIITNIILLQIVTTSVSFIYDLKIFMNEHRNGWYSTGAYYWSKAINELITTIIIIFSSIYIIDIYEDNNIFFGYLFFMTITVFCAQSIGHIQSIIFSDNLKICLLFGVGFGLIMYLLSNFLISVKELHYFLQWLSDFNVLKLYLECIFILFYGFDNCLEDEFSSILYFYGITDSDFYKNTRILIFLFILLRFLTLIIFVLKMNPMSNNKKQSELCESTLKSDPSPML